MDHHNPPEGDLAGRAYWDSTYGPAISVEYRDLARRGPRATITRTIDTYLKDHLFDGEPQGRSVLEIGAGASRWLPHLAHRHGAVVAGIDYSERGCQQARRLLKAASVTGTLYCADAFTPPRECLERFDAVVSFGVVEHFSDTTSTIRDFARFLRPGGRITTIIPNMRGITGSAQRLLNRPVYDQHLPLTKQELLSAHARAGLQLIDARYLSFVNLGVANLNGVPPGAGRRVRHLILGGLIGVSAIAWLIESAGLKLPANQFTSPYVACTARLAD